MRFDNRSGSILAAALLLLAVASPAHAQLGGLKKRLKDKVDGTTATKGAPATGDGPVYKAADKIAVTGGTLDQLVAGLRAERAERDRLMAAPTTNPDLLAYFKRQDQRAHCDSVKASVEIQRAALDQQAKDMMATATRDATQNPQAFRQKTLEMTQKMQALQQQQQQACDLGQKQNTPQSFFDALKSAQSQQDAIGAKASGLTVQQYAYLRERVVAVMLFEADRARGHYDIPTSYNGYSADEVAAIRSRASTIRTLVARDFDTNGDRKKDTDQ
jgi:hypothetical protein